MVAPAIFSETFHEIELLTDGRDYTREITIAWSLDPGKESQDTHFFKHEESRVSFPFLSIYIGNSPLFRRIDTIFNIKKL